MLFAMKDSKIDLELSATKLHSNLGNIEDALDQEDANPEERKILQSIFTNSALKIGGIISVCLAVILIGLGGIIPLVVKHNLDVGLTQKLVIDSADSPYYKSWLVSSDSRQSFTFFNITNLDQVQKLGAKPRLDAVGPYTFTLVEEYIDVWFSDQYYIPVESRASKGAYVTAKTWRRYIWNPESSCRGCLLSDRILTVNEVFLKVIGLVGGTDFGLYYQYLMSSLTSLTVIQPNSFLGSSMSHLSHLVLFNPQTYQDTLMRSMLVDAALFVAQRQGTNIEKTNELNLDLGLLQWADAQYFPNPVGVRGFEIAIMYGGGRLFISPLGAPIESLRRLFNTDGSNSPYALSDALGSQIWWDQTRVPELMAEFGLSKAQVVRIMSWFSLGALFQSETVPEAVIYMLDGYRQYGFGNATQPPFMSGLSTTARSLGYQTSVSPAQLGLLQWTNSFLTCGITILYGQGDSSRCVPSAADLSGKFPRIEFSAWASAKRKDLGNGGVCDISRLRDESYEIADSLYEGKPLPDFFGQVTRCSFFNLEQAAALWDSQSGLGNYVVLNAFMGENGTWSPQLLNELRISQFQATIMHEYLTDMTQTASDAYGLSTCGLFCEKSVKEWLFGSVDPFLLAVTADPAVSWQSMLVNITQKTLASEFLSASTWSTGFLGTDSIKSYSRWNQTNSLTGGTSLPKGAPWLSAEVVAGTDGSQFPLCHSGVSEDCMEGRLGKSYIMWSERLLRQVKVGNFDGSRGVTKGIGTLQLKYSFDVFQGQSNNPYNAKYYMHEDGFAPMARAARGMPLVLSKPFFLDAHPKWCDFLQNYPHIAPTDSRYNQYDTILSMEPMTGKVIQAQQLLQYSYNITSKTYSRFYPNIQTDFLFPSFYINDWGVISDSDAALLHQKTLSPLHSAKAFRMTAFIMGSILLLIGIGCYFKAVDFFKQCSDQEIEELYEKK
eukprot:Sdes_comp20056_c0_seq1m12927